MKLRYWLSPVPSDIDHIKYEYNAGVLTVTYNEQVDVFDFSVFTEDGIFDRSEIETTLQRHVKNFMGEHISEKFNPILSARIEDGTLHLELTYFIPEDCTDRDILFPDWKEVEANGELKQIFHIQDETGE